MGRLPGWWDGSWNVLGGCSPVSAGCRRCYAARWAGSVLHVRTPLYEGTTASVRGRAAFNGSLRVLPAGDPLWSWPLTWPGAKQPLLGAGQPSLIFVGVMTDLFHENWPRTIVDRVVGTVALSPHIGELLTKRPERMLAYFSEGLQQQRRKEHLWLGFSAENQECFDERWPFMHPLAVSGFVVFVSIAPMLGPVVLPADFLEFGRRIWVIVSGEEDWRARWMDPQWARALRDQCAEAGVPFFMLQMSGGAEIPRDLFVRQFPRWGSQPTDNELR